MMRNIFHFFSVACFVGLMFPASVCGAEATTNSTVQQQNTQTPVSEEKQGAVGGVLNEKAGHLRLLSYSALDTYSDSIKNLHQAALKQKRKKGYMTALLLQIADTDERTIRRQMKAQADAADAQKQTQNRMQNAKQAHKEKNAQVGALRGFLRNTFLQQTANARQLLMGGPTLPLPVKTAEAERAPFFFEHEKILFGEGIKRKNFDMMAPRRSGLPGSKQTLSQIEEVPTEMAVSYKLTEQNTARIAINSQDINSPLYTPLKETSMIGATGVYFDVEVEDNLKLQLGAEVRRHETDSLDRSSDSSSSGAVVGVQWRF